MDVEIDGDEGLAVGGGGVVFEFDGGEWSLVDAPTGDNLLACERGDVDLAVGAGGTVLEK